MESGEDDLVVQIVSNGTTIYVWKPYPPYTVSIGNDEFRWNSVDEIRQSNKVTSILLEWIDGATGRTEQKENE